MRRLCLCGEDLISIFIVKPTGSRTSDIHMQKLRNKLVQALKPKFAKIVELGISPQRVLDIGIANDSYLECKSTFPTARYDGIDFIDTGVLMFSGDRFYQRNLEESGSLTGLDPIYDVIIANHVLEHLNRGREVFGELCHLLAPGGYLYVEIPSLRTAYHPKRHGRYHFHDDPTHRRFYVLEDLANLAIDSNCKIISCGPATTWLKDAISLPRAIFSVLRGGSWGPYLLHFQQKIDHILVQRQRE
jgi:SAM-dependent methyltransferase